MRILIATPLYPPEIGGPATHAAFCEAELPRKGFTVSILPFATVRHLPRLIRHVAYFWKVFQTAKGVDAVYALDPFSVGFPAMLAAKLRGKKFIVRVPGDFAWEQGTARFGVTENLDTFALKTSGYGMYVRMAKLMQTWVATSAARVIVPSQYLKTIVNLWGVPEKNIVVVYSAFNPSPNDPPTYRTRPMRILSAGRLVKWKGFPGLVHAFSIVHAANPATTLTIVGDGECRPLVEEAIRESALSDVINLTGTVTHEELVRELAQARVFVLNTNYEGLSHAILEAMDAGVPIVTTPVGGNRELIHDGVEGVLVPYNDEKAMAAAVMKILNDDLLGDRLSRAARSAVARFSRTAVVDALSKALSV